MSTTDPRTGFTVRNSLSDESWQQAQAQAREAAQTEPPTTMGDVGQGVGRQQDTTGPFDPAKLGDHGYFTENREAIMAAYARGELPGQPNATTPTDN